MKSITCSTLKYEFFEVRTKVEVPCYVETSLFLCGYNAPQNRKIEGSNLAVGNEGSIRLYEATLVPGKATCFVIRKKTFSTG